jgi:hypothetical protein
MIAMIIFWAAGAFAVLLGILHFTFATRFHYMTALPLEGPDVPPFKLWFYQYQTKRSDLRGIIYVMNHGCSYTILLAGVFDLCYQLWEGTLAGALAALAVGGFWLVRAVSQNYLGHRPGDWFVMALFTGLFLLHVMPIALVAVTAYSLGLNH